MEENCIGSRSPQRTVVLEKKWTAAVYYDNKQCQFENRVLRIFDRKRDVLMFPEICTQLSFSDADNFFSL
jgi:hypothetical protein